MNHPKFVLDLADPKNYTFKAGKLSASLNYINDKNVFFVCINGYQNLTFTLQESPSLMYVLSQDQKNYIKDKLIEGLLNGRIKGAINYEGPG